MTFNPRYGNSEFEPADPKSPSKWSDGDSGVGEKRVAKENDYHDEDVR